MERGKDQGVKQQNYHLINNVSLRDLVIVLASSHCIENSYREKWESRCLTWKLTSFLVNLRGTRGANQVSPHAIPSTGLHSLHHAFLHLPPPTLLSLHPSHAPPPTWYTADLPQGITLFPASPFIHFKYLHCLHGYFLFTCFRNCFLGGKKSLSTCDHCEHSTYQNLSEGYYQFLGCLFSIL